MDYLIFALLSIAAYVAIAVWLNKRALGGPALVVSGAILLLVVGSGFVQVRIAGESAKDTMRKQISGLAPTYARELELMGHSSITTETPADDEVYLSMIEKQIEWLELNDAIADIYTFRKYEEGGNQLFVDSETDYDNSGAIDEEREERTEIGDNTWVEENEFLDRAYEGDAVFDDSIYKDRWGTWVSAYVPMYDENGEQEAVLGVDFPAADWEEAIASARQSVIGLLAVVVTLLLASTTIIEILRGNLAERRQSENQLREVAQRTRLIIDTAYASFVAIDRHGAIVDWNHHATETFGWSREEVLGKKLDETLVPKQYRKAHAKGLARYLATGEATILDQILELTALRKDGSEFPIEITITKMQHDDEATFFAFLHDISERKKAEGELRQAKEAAEEATKAKSEFLANMSHEIRTPMNGIIGMSELLSDTQLDIQQHDYLGMIRVSANSLLRLLNDILDFSKIEAGKLELEHVDFRLRDCISKSAQTLASRASEKGVELACRIAPEIPDRLVGDPGRLGQIVVNLVGNAVKFTDTGEVVVEVKTNDQEFESSDSIGLLVTVRDTGVGIPQDKQSRVFELFNQADASTTRRYGGTGLGLAISRQLVEMMGGSTWVDSVVGEGSSFHFTAVFGTAANQSHDLEIDSTQLTDTPILIVDDNETNQRVFEEIFKTWQMNPTVAFDGFSALAEMKRAAEKGNPFRLVLTDCMMPGMDGFQLASLIRADSAISDCAIVMVSSGANSEHAAECKKHRIVRYMLKPVVQSELLETLVGAIQESAVSPRTGTNEQRSLSIHEGLDILLVEDGIVNQRVAMGMLKMHNVSIANHGREAVEALEKNRYDIVLMDVQMPEMDGIEATGIIRAREGSQFRRTPIIAMTASAMKGDRERCLEAGMDGYIAKPITASELHGELAKYVPEGGSSDNSDGESESNSANTTVSSDGASIIDVDTALQRVAGGEDDVLDIAGVMLEQCPVLMKDIHEGIRDKDMKRVQRGGHSLKGCADIFSAKGVVEQARRIEVAGEQEDLDAAIDALPELCDRVERFKNALQQLINSKAK